MAPWGGARQTVRVIPAMLSLASLRYLPDRQGRTKGSWLGALTLLPAVLAAVTAGCLSPRLTQQLELPFYTVSQSLSVLKSLLWQALHPGRPPLSNTAPVMKPTPCDCTDSRLSGRRTVSVAAGPLLVANAAVLGSVGEVLVLANDADRRIYYVCQNSVSFSG